MSSTRGHFLLGVCFSPFVSFLAVHLKLTPVQLFRSNIRPSFAFARQESPALPATSPYHPALVRLLRMELRSRSRRIPFLGSFLFYDRRDLLADNHSSSNKRLCAGSACCRCTRRLYNSLSMTLSGRILPRSAPSLSTFCPRKENRFTSPRP